MDMSIKKVREHVILYFKDHLPQYTVLEITRKSSHPDDTYLWMVSAKKSNGTFAVWTSWNESTQCLNFGHYDLASIEECEKIFKEFFYKG